jgi:hypothetical protein
MAKKQSETMAFLSAAAASADLPSAESAVPPEVAEEPAIPGSRNVPTSSPSTTLTVPNKTETRAFNQRKRIRALINGESREFATIEEKFEALAENWDEFNIGRSITSFDHPAYHQIMTMGEAVIPLLIDRLRQGEDDWVYALKCITGEQVESAEMYGDSDRVVQAWVEWYEARTG